MKPQQITKTNLKSIPPANSWKGLKISNTGNSFQDLTVPLPMTQHEVEPPAYIWDKIAKALDEQDRVKALEGIPAVITAKPSKKGNQHKSYIIYSGNDAH